MVVHCWKDDGLKLLSVSLSFGAFAAAVKMSFYMCLLHIKPFCVCIFVFRLAADKSKVVAALENLFALIME